MRIPAIAVKLLAALAVIAASVSCIAPSAYAQDAAVTMASEGGNRVVVDVDLNVGAPVGDATGQARAERQSWQFDFDAESDRARKEFVDELHAFEVQYIIMMAAWPVIIYLLVKLLKPFS